jgi:hypothetical protein
MKEAKPILIVKLNYDLESIQAELIETDLKAKVDNEYHVWILSGNMNQKEPFKFELINQADKEFDFQEFNEYVKGLINEAEKALINELKMKISKLTNTAANLIEYIKSQGKEKDFKEYMKKKEEAKVVSMNPKTEA